jgi:hypothetical protein
VIWTKTKRALEALLADTVKKRVRYHATRYTAGGVSYYFTRAWITWDGGEIVNFSTAKQEVDARQLAQRLGGVDAYGYPSEQAYGAAKALGIFSRDDFDYAVETYLAASIDAALASDDPNVRALAMFDRRVGKRRLAKLAVETEYPLVRKFYELRCQAEGLSQAESAQ